MGVARILSLVLGLSLIAAPAFAKGGHGGGGHGGGGHSGGGHGGGHASAGGGRGGAHASVLASSGWADVKASPGWTGASFGTHSFSASSSPASSASLHSASHTSFFAPPTVGPTRFHDVVVDSSLHADARSPVHVQGHVREFAVTPRIRATWVAPRASWRIPAAYETYFVAYPEYVEESAWVTDWVMVDLLVDEEASAQPATDDAPPSALIGAREKEMLRSEVDRDLAETAAGETEEDRMARAFADPSHVFVVTKDVAVDDATHPGRCTLSRADLLRAVAPVSRTDARTRVTVLAAKRGSCAPSTTVTIDVAELEQFERDLLGRVDRADAEAKTAGDQL